MVSRSLAGWLACAALVTAAHARAQALPPPPVPLGNPITPAKVNLGKALFFEEQMSSSGTVACATCHLPEAGGGDPRTPFAVNPGFDGVFGTPDDVHGSPGVIAHDAAGRYLFQASFPLRQQVTPRKAPSAINAAYNPLQFWDGRAGGPFVDPVSGVVLLTGPVSLESQAVAPPVSSVEMAHVGGDWTEVAVRLASARPLALASNLPLALETWIAGRDYPALFQEAFGSPSVTPAAILMAIATYERTLVADQTPLDRFRAGDPTALTPQEQRGLAFFGGPGRCVRCHGGPMLSNQGFFVIGVRPPFEDLGRGAITQNPVDNGAFKVPSLRNVGLRPAYFHNGEFQSLDQVVDFYARGGDFRQNQTLLIQPFPISPQDHAALVAFLSHALTDPRVAARTAPFDRPTLFSESGRAPKTYGQGAAGSGGLAPRLVAIDPPVLGNRQWTLGLADARAGQPGVLMLDAAAAPAGSTVLGLPKLVAGTSQMALVPLGNLGGGGAVGGFASAVLQVPDDPSLAGVSVFLQAAVADPSVVPPVAVSAGVQATLFAPR